MNRALDIKNWDKGGNSYVLKGDSPNKWVGWIVGPLTTLVEKFGDEFNIVIYSDVNKEDDYYCIPFEAVKHLFIEDHKTTGEYNNRWTTTIRNGQLRMHGNSSLSINISPYYGSALFFKPPVLVDDDFYIENAKAEINVRLGQSKFRNGVLKNFSHKCALTGINETSLLTASHIVPWSHKKEYRADIANGICFYIEYDALFDKGFFTLTDDLEVTITKRLSLTDELFNRLKLIEGNQLSSPINKKINVDYLKYHRENVFDKKTTPI